MSDTYENEAMEAINEYINLAKNDNKEYFDREFGNIYMKSIFEDYIKFANDLFKGPDLQFIPLMITTQIGIIHYGILKTDYQEYLSFVFKHQDLFKELHERLREMYYKDNQDSRETNEEAIKQILLAEASIERRQPMNFNSLLKAIYGRIYTLPYLPNTNSLYNFYVRNLPGTVARSNTRTMPRISTQNNEEEKIKRLPWKSRLKANDYMKKLGWNEQQKELARNYLKNDYFNIKKNKKNYQLHLIAPRHTFIIDLFFPGKFVYLLAVNVNTRKAFAIPSPLITKQTNFRFNVPNEGHKTVPNVLRMFDKLLRETPIKMIIHDKEPAFLSNEFKTYCRNHNITIKPYNQYNVSGLTETNETTRTLHGRLSILDRLCRTIRNVAYNMGVINQEIDPNVMRTILQIYNSSPHTAFYKALHLNISPDEMDSDKKLEDAFCYQLSKQNFVIMNNENFEINCPVRVFNEASLFDKLKHKLLPGIFQIVGKEGNLFVCKQGNTIIKVPRWMIREAEI